MSGNRIKSLSLITKDNVHIAADYFEGRSSHGVVLLHMMPETRSSWDSFALTLQENGFHVLSIDLRGHGESDGGPEGYRVFSNAEHQSSAFDVEAAIAYLRREGITMLHLIGASIGANLALQELQKDTDVITAVLLSPGLNYSGIETLPIVEGLAHEQSVLFIASRDDIRDAESSAADEAEALYEACAAEKDMEIFDEGGHGTKILEAYPDFAESIVDWIYAHS